MQQFLANSSNRKMEKQLKENYFLTPTWLAPIHINSDATGSKETNIRQ